MPNIAFIGLGTMGSPMAKRLLDSHLAFMKRIGLI